MAAIDVEGEAAGQFAPRLPHLGVPGLNFVRGSLDRVLDSKIVASIKSLYFAIKQGGLIQTAEEVHAELQGAAGGDKSDSTLKFNAYRYGLLDISAISSNRVITHDFIRSVAYFRQDVVLFPMKRWGTTPKRDAYDNFQFKPNDGDHWVLVAAYMKSKELVFYDSLASPSHSEEVDDVKRFFDDLCRSREYKKLFPDTPESVSWSTRFPSSPNQRNGTDCGVFALMAADYIVRKEPIPETNAQWPQSVVAVARQRIAIALLRFAGLQLNATSYELEAVDRPVKH